MRDWKILLLLSILIIFVYFPAFNTFFAQDDFIFINHFSQNNLTVDIKNVFGPPEVTHWRPMHNLYFLIAGNIFGKHYFGYHLMTITLHIFSCFLIFKIFKKLFWDEDGALIASVIYGIHPAHFVALFWISGGAVTIGFCFLTLSIYSLLLGKRPLAFLFYLLSLLASEAMIAGLLIFVALLIFKKRAFKERVFLLSIFLVSISFLAIRFVFLTPKTTFEVYQLEFSTSVFSAIKYYLLKIAGFVEGYGKSFVSLTLALWLTIVVIIFFSKQKASFGYRKLWVGILILLVGLFPFVLIPNHLSAHYMSISIWGFSIMVGLLITRVAKRWLFFLMLIFLSVSFVSVRLNMRNSWVISRANLAKELIAGVQEKNLADETRLVFSDDEKSSSKEKYISLGQGQAIDFWFAHKNYKSCFTFLENCWER